MKQTIILLMLTLSGCSGWHSEDDTCQIYPEITWVQDCEYSIAVHVYPDSCADDLAGYMFSWGDFHDEFIPATHGAAEFIHDFDDPGIYILDIEAVNRKGDIVSRYSKTHEFDCGGGAE